jgi:uncharacterized protein (TIGR02271 family)
MSMGYTTSGITTGADVFGADGEKVGTVAAVYPGYIVVEKGFFFPTDYYIPTSAIANVDEDNVYLTVSKEEALNQGWDQPLTTTTIEGDDRFRATTTEAELAAAGGAGYGVESTERVRVPVHEEELTATKRPVEAGAVRIEKDVVTEERTLEVPVTEERVVVRQVAADRAATGADATAFEEGVIEVPLRREEVDVQKRTRVAGEVEVEKEAVQRTEQVAGTVRREEVRVDDQTVEGAEFFDERTDQTGREIPR